MPLKSLKPLKNRNF